MTLATEMKMKKTAVRLALIAAYLPAAAITPVAYFFLPLGILTGVEAAGEGTSLVGILVSVVSLLALFSLWRLWSIGKRLWAHSAYVPPLQGGRRRDGIGLLAGWIAFGGIFALSGSEEPFGLGLGLLYSLFVLPAAALATLAFFLWAQPGTANKSMHATCEDARA